MSADRPAADATTRFSNRVDAYARHRPGYPVEVVTRLARDHGLERTHVVADVGSGTGLFAELLLRNGNTVVGVEPNDAMRTAGAARLAAWPAFRSVAGSAEQTGLPDASVDWVAAAQAFHWFDVRAARREFLRILRPATDWRPRVVLLWNVRREDTPFLRDYEAVLRELGTDYDAVRHQNVESDGRLGTFFGPQTIAFFQLPNRQVLDFDGLHGRTFSASYVPPETDARGVLLAARLRELFDRHAENGRVVIEYDTRVYVGDLSAEG